MLKCGENYFFVEDFIFFKEVFVDIECYCVVFDFFYLMLNLKSFDFRMWVCKLFFIIVEKNYVC